MKEHSKMGLRPNGLLLSHISIEMKTLGGMFQMATRQAMSTNRSD